MLVDAKSKVFLYFVLIFAVAVFLRIAAFQGYVGSDDDAYAVLSYNMMEGNSLEGLNKTPIFPLRVGIIWPVSVLFRVFGVTEFAIITYPFLISLANLVLVFFAGKLLCDDRAGLIAACLYAIIPLDVKYSSMLFPDAIVSFWINLGVVLIFYGIRCSKLRVKLFVSLLGGMSFAFSWFCKESTFYLLPFLGLFFVWAVWRDKRNVFPVSIFLFVFLSAIFGEMLVYRNIRGDQLYHFHEMERNYEVCKKFFFAEGSEFGWSEGGYLSAVLERLFIEGPRKLLFIRLFGGINLAAAAGVIYFFIKRMWKFLFPCLWFLFVFLMFNFGSSSITRYRPLVLMARYMYPIIFPAVLVVSILFSHFLGEINKFGIAWKGLLFFCPIIGLLLFVSARDNAWSIQTRRPQRAVYTLSEFVGPQNNLYSDKRSIHMLSFYERYPEKHFWQDFRGMDIAGVSGGSYIFINRKKVEFLKNLYSYQPPDFYDSVPKDWDVVFSEGSAVLYRCSGGGGE